MSQTGKQVFIVDDDKSVCRALKVLLMTYDFKDIPFRERFFHLRAQKRPRLSHP